MGGAIPRASWGWSAVEILPAGATVRCLPQGLDIAAPMLQPAGVPAATPATPRLPPAPQPGLGRRLGWEIRNVILCIALAALVLAGGIGAVIVVTAILTRAGHP